MRPSKDFEVLTVLRDLVKGQPVNAEAVAETGLTVEQLQDLVDRMKKARFGVLFFGMGLSMTRGKHMNSAGLLALAAEMNAFTKFVAMPMRGHGNVTGADVVMPGRRATRSASICVGVIRDSTPASFRRSICSCAATTTPRWILGAAPARRCRSRPSTTWRRYRRSRWTPR